MEKYHIEAKQDAAARITRLLEHYDVTKRWIRDHGAISISTIYNILDPKNDTVKHKVIIKFMDAIKFHEEKIERQYNARRDDAERYHEKMMDPISLEVLIEIKAIMTSKNWEAKDLEDILSMYVTGIEYILDVRNTPSLSVTADMLIKLMRYKEGEDDE